MKILKPEEILPLVHNVLKTELDEEGRLRFRRFTPEQVEDYFADGPDFAVRCRASANVTLDFVTDSDRIEMDYDLLAGSSRKTYDIDLYVDGTLLDTKHEEGFEPGAAAFSLPEGSHRVTLFLPWSAELMLKSFALSDGASVSPAPQKSMRILAIGDSITQGYKARHPGCSWVGKVTRDLDAEVLNLGVGGYRFFTNSLQHPCVVPTDLIVLAYGTNDYSHTEEADAYRRAELAYMERLTELYPGVPILQLLPLYRNDESYREKEARRAYTLEDARQIIRENAERFPQVTVMETAFFPHPADFFAADYLHPVDPGFLILGERVVRKIREMGFPKGKK